LTATRGSSTQIFVWSGAGLLGTAALWRLLSLVLSTDRGLDLTDEGLYLLEADPPGRHASWGAFPFGWHTRPLFALVGYDIAAFRTLGALLLIVAGAWLGVEAGRLAFMIRTSVSSTTLNLGSETSSALVAGATGALGLMLYYGSFLRTPSYNWVNLFGIILTAAAVLSLVRVAVRSSFGLGLKLVTLTLTASFGMFFSIPGKPSSWFFLLVLTWLLVTSWLGWQRGLTVGAGLVAGLVFWVGIALVLGAWSLDFLQDIPDLLSRPALMRAQTVFGASQEALDYPRTVAYEVYRSASPPGMVLAAFGFSMALLSLASGRASQWFRIAGITAIGASAFIVFGGTTFLSRGLDGQVNSSPSQIITATYILLLGSVVTLLLSLRDQDHLRGLTPIILVRTSSVVVFLGLLPLIYGFGSGSGIYRQSAASFGTVILAAVFVALLNYNTKVRLAALTLLLMLTIALVTKNISGGKNSPYRIAPIPTNVVPVEIGAQGTILNVDPDLAAMLQSLDRQATSAGWQPGTPLLGVAWRWSSSVPYFLGARVPGTLMLTLFGYGTATQIADFNIARMEPEFKIREAWILTDTNWNNEPDVLSVLTTLEEITGLSFPQDFQCAASSGTLQLWKPNQTNSLEAASECLDPIPSTSRYDSSNGFVG